MRVFRILIYPIHPPAWLPPSLRPLLCLVPLSSFLLPALAPPPRVFSPLRIIKFLFQCMSVCNLCRPFFYRVSPPRGSV